MEIIKNLIEGTGNLNVFSIILRIVLSVLCGSVLGIERGKANQSAGMRTHILVCLGASLIMMTGQYMFDEFQTGDPARLGAQVISGIGFLGAGSIIVEGRTKVRGLTTAAGVWIVACIGLAIGIGFYAGGVITTLLAYLAIAKFRAISDHFTHNDMWQRVYVEFKSINSIEEVCETLKVFGMQIGDVMMNNPYNSGCYNAIISYKNINNKEWSEIEECLKETAGIDAIKFVG
mgnify:CR=1 FL=1